MSSYKICTCTLVFIIGVVIGSNSQANTPTMKVLITEQSAEGMSDADMTQEFLDRITEHYKKRVISLSGLTEQQALAAQKSIKVESVYLTDRGKKLMIMRLHQITPPFYNLVVGGLTGDKFVRVSCIWDVNKRISASQGECGEKIEATFHKK